MVDRVILDHRDALAKLRAAGYKAYIVGGYARELAFGKPPRGDVDVVVNAAPDDILKVFPEAKHVSGNFSETVYVPVSSGSFIEVSPMMKAVEGAGVPAYAYTDDINEDLARRDATMNAIAFGRNEFVDPFHGVQDISDGILRAVGDPIQRIAEHPIRLMRYIRFYSQYPELKMDKALDKAIAETAETILVESWDAIGKELLKGLAVDDVASYVANLQAWDIIKHILPEVEAMVWQDQNKYHKHNVFGHTIDSLEEAAKIQLAPEEMLAVLLHDVGKPRTAELRDKEYGYTFYKHEIIGAKMARDICTRLRLGNETAAMVEMAVRWHMYRVTNIRTAKRFLARLNQGDQDSVDFVLNTMYADRAAHRKGISGVMIQDYALGEKLVLEVMASKEPYTLKDLEVNGKDVMERLGIGPSKAVGNTLDYLLAAVIKKPELNNPNALLMIAEEYYDAQYPSASGV